LKLGTVVVLNTVSKPIDFGFKRSGFRAIVGGWGLRFRVTVRESAPICISAREHIPLLESDYNDHLGI